MEQHEFFLPTSSPKLNWIEIKPQVHIMTLNGTPHGRRTLLQRHEPGTVDAEESLHDYFEEVYILEGDLHDTRTGKTYETGWYAYRKPGMVHGPFSTEKGCLMYITCTPAETKAKEN